jgi:hypothetical protein
MDEATREIPYEDVDIAAVRRYANARASESSVRQVAGQVGLGHTSFGKFLRGSAPFARNRILLCEWYLRELPVHPVREPLAVTRQPPPDDPEVHLDALLSELQDSVRLETRLRITTIIAKAYQRMGLPNPDWLYARR